MQVSVEEMLRPDEQPSNNQGEKKNRFFSLVDDGNSAIVRFLHTDINDFEVLDVHTIELGGYNRKINCLRSPNGSKDECALCSANEYNEEKGSYKYPLQRKFYIHMLRYDNPQTAVEQVWERSKDYIKKLHQLVEDYGPLHNRLYKIVRHGAKGSTDTTYDILPLDKDRYDPSGFVFNPEQLNYEKALNNIVLNYTNEGINEYLQTGNFPNFKGKKEDNKVVARPEPTQSAPTQSFNTQPTMSSQPFGSQPQQPTYNFMSNEPRRRV